MPVGAEDQNEQEVFIGEDQETKIQKEVQVLARENTRSTQLQLEYVR